MGRQRKARRFDTEYCVSEASLQAVAEHLQREVENYSVLAPADVETKLVERHANCENSWKQLCLFLEAMPEPERRILQAMVFRDLWFVVELYRTYVQQSQPTGIGPAPVRFPRTSQPPLKFSEFLFDLSQ